MPAAIGISSRERRSSRACSGVRAGARPAAPAIRPISVAAPVAVTTKRPAPRATVVPASSEVCRSASGASAGSGGAARLLVASDSPVSADSSTCRSVASTSRPSAGTRSPAPRATTSPTTTSSAGRSLTWPPRRRCAVGASSARTAAAALSARPSCTAPKMALATTMARITAASSSSPIASEITAAPTSSRTIELTNWRATRASRDGGASRRSSFGPSDASRLAASARSGPCARRRPARRRPPRRRGRARC